MQQHPSCAAKCFNQVPEHSQLPSEVKFDKKKIEKGDYSPLGSVKAKQNDPTLLQGLWEKRLPALSTLRSCCCSKSAGDGEYRHTLGSIVGLHQALQGPQPPPCSLQQLPLPFPGDCSNLCLMESLGGRPWLTPPWTQAAPPSRWRCLVGMPGHCLLFRMGFPSNSTPSKPACIHKQDPQRVQGHRRTLRAGTAQSLPV